MIPGIGNMVLVNGVPTEIYSIVSDGSGGYGYNSFEGGMPLFYEFTPIPLTPDLLIKNCQFRQVSETVSQYIDGHFMLECDSVNLYLVIEGQLLKIPHLIYLHQLQNLVLGLSGRELTVNLY